MTAPTVDTPADETPAVSAAELDDLAEFCRVHERRNAGIAAEIKVEVGEPGQLSRECFEARALGFRRLRDALMQSRAALLAARREVEALRAAATDCADDLEAELRNRYHYPDVHPAMQGKYERDMESVLAVRAALAATPEEK